MSIFLLILKIIGITLLSIIGLILFLLLIILFVPFRYDVMVSNRNEDEKLYARARVTWLLHFVNCLVSYMEELYYRVRITFFKIISSDKKEKKEKKEKKKREREQRRKKKKEDDGFEAAGEDVDDVKAVVSKKAADTDAENIAGAADADNIASDDDSTIDDTAGADDADSAESDDNSDIYRDNDDSDDDTPEEKQKFFEKARIILQKIFDFLFNIREKVSGIVKKVKDIKDNIDYYIDAVNDERNKEAFSLCLSALMDILKSIRPRKIKGNLLISREDPYSLGQMSSYLAIAYPFLSDKISIQTKSGEDITSYYLYIKGKVTVFVLVVVFFKIYFNKDVKRMIKIFKHEAK